MVDYNKLLQTTQRLINANGRDITLVQLDRTASDPAQPWRGDPTPRTVPAAQEVVVKAVFVDPVSMSKWGFTELDAELIGRMDETCLIAGGYATIEDFDEVLDGTTRFKIDKVARLKPADVTMIYALGLLR